MDTSSKPELQPWPKKGVKAWAAWSETRVSTRTAITCGTPASTNAWAAASEHERSVAWADDMRQRGTLSLRDPLEPTRNSSRPCEFEIAHQLGCRGHAQHLVMIHEHSPRLRASQRRSQAALVAHGPMASTTRSALVRW